jgi:ABC-2 type transport system permease protein
MTTPAFTMAVRLRAVQTGLSALGMLLVILMVGALFPSVGDSIGQLDVPEGVAKLLGGADYGSIEGWMNSEIGAIYGPLVVAATAITGAVGAIAGEEEDGILGLTMAHPIERPRLLLAKAAAVAVSVTIVVLGTFAGLLAGVAVAGGGIGVGHMAALALHLECFGLMIGALALALAAATGRKPVAAGGAAAFAVLGFLVNGFAPLVDAIEWLKYLSPFYYYEGNNPLANGVDVGNLLVLLGTTVVLCAAAVAGFGRRDLRG